MKQKVLDFGLIYSPNCYISHSQKNYNLVWKLLGGLKDLQNQLTFLDSSINEAFISLVEQFFLNFKTS